MFRTIKPLDRLRQAYGLSALPDMIETETFGEFGHQISKPLVQATIDDVAFRHLLQCQAAGLTPCSQMLMHAQRLHAPYPCGRRNRCM